MSKLHSEYTKYFVNSNLEEIEEKFAKLSREIARLFEDLPTHRAMEAIWLDGHLSALLKLRVQWDALRGVKQRLEEGVV